LAVLVSGVFLFYDTLKRRHYLHNEVDEMVSVMTVFLYFGVNRANISQRTNGSVASQTSRIFIRRRFRIVRISSHITHVIFQISSVQLSLLTFAFIVLCHVDHYQPVLFHVSTTAVAAVTRCCDVG